MSGVGKVDKVDGVLLDLYTSSKNFSYGIFTTGFLAFNDLLDLEYSRIQSSANWNMFFSLILSSVIYSYLPIVNEQTKKKMKLAPYCVAVFSLYQIWLNILRIGVYTNLSALDENDGLWSIFFLFSSAAVFLWVNRTIFPSKFNSHKHKMM